jgi:hypothetical protein
MEESREDTSQAQTCSPEEREKYRRLHEIARDSFYEQLDRAESFDRKAQINLIIIGIIVGFGFYKAEFMSDLIAGFSLRCLINSLKAICLGLSFSFFAASLVLSILVLLLKKTQVHPDVRDLMKEFEARKVEDLDASMASHFQEAIDANEQSLKSKARKITKAFLSILIAFSLGIIFLVLTVASKAFHL